MQAATEVVHYYNIKVIDNRRNIILFLAWSGLRWELRLKYDWYFKYRAALAQVQNPRCEVQLHWGHEPATGKTKAQMLKDKVSAKKAKITETKNKLQKAKDNWNLIFPIEDDPDYQRAVDKIARLEFELQSLQNQPA